MQVIANFDNSIDPVTATNRVLTRIHCHLWLSAHQVVVDGLLACLVVRLLQLRRPKRMRDV